MGRPSKHERMRAGERENLCQCKRKFLIGLSKPSKRKMNTEMGRDCDQNWKTIRSSTRRVLLN